MRADTPFSHEAEAGLLGALLLDNSSMTHVSWLEEDAFHLPGHKEV